MRRAALLCCLATLALASTADEPESVVAGEVEPAAKSWAGQFVQAFGESFGIILATEIGDRTFFIAAIMAMRHSRFIVWAGAVGALVVMTVLSTLVGHVAPLLVPKTYTHYAAASLFLFFGVKMLREGFTIDHTGAPPPPPPPSPLP